MNEQPVAVKPDRRRRVKLGLAQSMMLLLALLLLLLLAHLGPALARRQAKVDDEWMDDQEEGASRIGGGLRVKERPRFLGTAWSVLGRLVGNAIRLNSTFIIMHVGTTEDVFKNATRFCSIGVGLGINWIKSERQPEQLNFDDYLQHDPQGGSGLDRKNEIALVRDLALGRTNFRLYRITDPDPTQSSKSVGRLDQFMESNEHELGKECFIYGWSDTPRGETSVPQGASVNVSIPNPNVVKLVRVAVTRTKCNAKGRCEIFTSGGSVCRSNADRGAPIMCGQGERKKLTYLIDRVEGYYVGECLQNGQIWAFHTSTIFNTVNYYGPEF